MGRQVCMYAFCMHACMYVMYVGRNLGRQVGR